MSLKGMNSNVTIYEPDNSIRRGYRTLWAEILRELWNNRWLALQLFKRDFCSAYQQSLLGILWTFITPLASIGAFMLLDRSGIFNVGQMNVPYPLFAVLGMAFWQLFAAGVMTSSQSLVDAGPMITRINFSKKALVIAAMGRAVVAFLLQLGLVGLLLFAYHFRPHLSMFLLPLIAVPVLLLTIGLGFLLAIINGVIRDVGNALPVCLMFLMFLTPVLYVRPQAGFLADLAAVNPLYHFVTAARDLVFTGGLSDASGLFWSAVGALVIAALCMVAFHMTETRINERL
jgi:lipopolysaccharide transport system permease protein